MPDFPAVGVTAVQPRWRPLLRQSAPRGRWPSLGVASLVAACAAVGVAVRAWLLFHVVPTADEDVAGLIARQILHGHTYAFFWGQPFGGVEPYVVAAVFAVGGQGTLTLELAPVLLSAVAAVLAWRCARRLLDDRALAVLAGALVWAAPYPFVDQSTYEGGYREVVLVCGLGAVLLALRVLDGHRTYADFAGLGLVAGVGWWALPEIVYFLVPAALLLVAAVVEGRRRGGRWWVARLASGTAALGAGALPWLWVNVADGWQSLRPSAFAGSSGPLATGYGGRLVTLLRDAFPLALGLRPIGGDRAWLFGLHAPDTNDWVLIVLLVGALAWGLACCAARGGRAWVLVVAVVGLPLLTAVQPGTWYWEDGRYELYTGPLVVLLLVVAAEETGHRWASRRALAPPRRARRRPSPIRDPSALGPAARRRVARPLFALVVVGAVALCLLGFARSWRLTPSSYLQGWRSPGTAEVAAARGLLAHHITAGYADYWVAYPLDLVGAGRLELTVAGTDPDRWPQLTRSVAHAVRAAWLFVSPSELRLAEHVVATTPEIQGPSGIAESAFVAALRHHGVPFRVVRAGLLTAVVPARRVTLRRLGLTPAPG